MNDLERLSQYVGKIFNYDNLNACMIDDIDAGTEIDVYKDITRSFKEFGACTLYKVYYDIENSNIYNVWVSRNNIIADIKEC